MAKKKMMAKKKLGQTFFHASKARIRVGDYVYPNPGCEPRRFGVPNRKPKVFLVNVPVFHYTLVPYSKEDPPRTLYLYEVKPLGKVWLSSFWDELVTDQPCLVLRLVKSQRFQGVPDFGEQDYYKAYRRWQKFHSVGGAVGRGGRKGGRG